MNNTEKITKHKKYYTEPITITLTIIYRKIKPLNVTAARRKVAQLRINV